MASVRSASKNSVATLAVLYLQQSSSLADGSVARTSKAVVLAEDARHQRFVYRYLERLHYSEGDIRPEPLPSGRGCGEQWVRERYANAVQAYRWRSARAWTALIVAIDADSGDLGRRLRQLQDALLRDSLAPRTDKERIVHLIPKRNVETWILNLNGRNVDEDTDYRREQRVDEQIANAASTFFDWTRPNATPPPHCVPSLLSAIPEVRRLE